jgi:hypothetical protein
MDYIVEEKLAGLHRKLSAAELKQLEDNCVQDGRIIDPIVVWGRYVLDGVHRLGIAEKHGLEYVVTEVDVASFEDAMLWVINHQLGKRNISDFEAQRLRAEQARMLGDTEEVAKQHGVSRRTVQRDVEAQDARSLMSPDILAKCDKGAIINHRADWKRYKELTDDQRLAVDETLRRDPSLRLGQAIPNDRVSLTPQDFAVINESCLTPQQKQSLSLGTLFADSKAVKKFASLQPAEQEFIVDILDDPEIDDLGDAILTLQNGFGKEAIDEGKKLQRARDSVDRALDKLESTFKDVHSIQANHSCYMACMEHLKKVREEWTAWR